MRRWGDGKGRHLTGAEHGGNPPSNRGERDLCQGGCGHRVLNEVDPASAGQNPGVAAGLVRPDRRSGRACHLDLRYTEAIMSSAARAILDAALKLDPQQREELIEELSASLDATNLGEYWEAEIKRRIDDVDSGRVKTVPADEVFARLEQRFRGK